MEKIADHRNVDSVLFVDILPEELGKCKFTDINGKHGHDGKEWRYPRGNDVGNKNSH